MIIISQKKRNISSSEERLTQLQAQIWIIQEKLKIMKIIMKAPINKNKIIGN
jgi:hypothetical protein